MLIKIVRGAYGHRPTGRPRTHTVRAGETVEVSADEAKRLVGLGVAECVEELVSAGLDVPDKETGHLDREQLMELTRPRLAAMASQMGLDTSKCKNKSEIVDLIVAVEVEPGEEIQPEEELPDLTAEEPEG